MTAPTEPTEQQPTAQTEGTDWKAEARKWETRAKENSAAAARLAELEDAQKTEQQKLAEQLAAAESSAQQATLTSLKLDVALAQAPEGMSVQQVRKLAGRLTGATREELEADAAELFAEFATRPAPAGDPRRPVESLRPGALPASDSAAAFDPDTWIRRQAGR